TSRRSSPSGKASSRWKFPTRRRCRRASTPTKASARSCSFSPTKPAKPATKIAAANTRRKKASCCRSYEPYLEARPWICPARFEQHGSGTTDAPRTEPPRVRQPRSRLEDCHHKRSEGSVFRDSEGQQIPRSARDDNLLTRDSLLNSTSAACTEIAVLARIQRVIICRSL